MTQLQSRGSELLKSLRSSRHRRRKLAPPRDARFSLEGLEVRVAPATWTGHSLLGSQWYHLRNWEQESLPINGDRIVFPADASHLHNVNTFSGLRVQSLTIQGEGYRISGDHIRLEEGITADYTSGESEIRLGLELHHHSHQVKVSPGGTLNLEGHISGDHQAGISATGGGTLILSGHSTYGGTTSVSESTTLIVNGSVRGPVALNGGTLEGHGRIHGDLTSTGTDVVAPGLEGQGILDVDGDVTLGTGSTFQIHIGGVNAGSGYTQLIARGDTALGGATLSVSTDGFTPAAGQEFTIIRNTGEHEIQGRFDGLREGATVKVGDQSFRISYFGGQDRNNVTLTALGQTTVMVTASPTATKVGEPVTFTAMVSSETGTPTGKVLFKSDGNPIGDPVDLDATGTAVFTTSSLPAGSHTITAEYEGSGDFARGTGSLGSNPFVVTADTSTTSLAMASSNPVSNYGQSVTFTATITSSGTDPITGTVTFINGETGDMLGTGQVQNGQATFSTSSLPVGLRWIAAGYSGDSANTGSSNAVVQQTDPASTSLSLASSNASAGFGQPVTFTATVTPGTTGGSSPSGIVSFINGETGEVIGTGQVQNGQATLTTSSLPAGTRWIAAGYSGDQNYAGSTNAVVQQTDPNTTTLAVTSSSSPSAFGQAVTFTATITPGSTGGPAPTGTVTFINGETGDVLGTGQVQDGQATFTTSSLPVGTRWIAAGYGGDSTYAGSSNAVVQETNPASTTTTLTSSLNPAVFGQSVTYTASVAVPNEGASDPRGGIAFYDGTNLIGIAPVVNGQGVLTLPATGAGQSHSITAQYVAESSWQNSTSSALNQQIQASQTETTLTATAVNTRRRRSVILTSQVKSLAPGVGTPTGRVIFAVDGQPVRAAELNNGRVSIEIPPRGFARRGITAVYEGTSDFLTSQSPVLVLGGTPPRGPA